MIDVDAIAAQLVDGLRVQIPAAGFQLAGIAVDLGEMVDLDPGELRAALSRQLPGVEIEVRRVQGVLRCLDCGAEYPSDEHPCPVCGSGRAELIHGTELAVARAWGAAG